MARASVPAGISAGKYEVKNVSAQEAFEQINSAKKTIIGLNLDQERLDNLLLESGLAGNASLAVSAAFWKAGLDEKARFTKFPGLLTLMFEGGKHGSGNITVQEFTLVESTLTDAISDFSRLKKHLEENKVQTTVGAEGAFSPAGFDNWKCLDTLAAVFPDKKLALDVAGSFVEGEVDYGKLVSSYNILSIEDPYSDDQWDKWKQFYSEFGDKIMVVGDDLTATNPERIRQAVTEKAVNAVIIKPNQNGTMTGTFEAVKTARENKLAVIVSHRAKETDDDWIVDFALTVEADFVKFGGIDRGERVAKYNRLRFLGMK